ncbi:predicted protein [Plenodomus lingam JN3]|uniref:Predicted protein n=1 Tax=Leptosphaeria maculans (strain JN3 / isolate v23.1.3 / race Av1-4-5-6-7-8) TaxID=985895 RepID=E4ZZM7_LEPMJ|nr:predicted protein [Plenodomus lingam JN3]CBX97143.1 predicted protein [Plenodomus lingam JN3]
MTMFPTPKSLHDDSQAPRIYSTTLPQHRLNQGEVPRPLQGEYPVWYFLTGGISRQQILMNLLKLDRLPDMRPASIRDMKVVQTQYCSSLVAATTEDVQAGRDVCEGYAYLVKSEVEELALRQFKTALYDIVRCKITISKTGTFSTYSDVEGLTFVYTSGETSFQTLCEHPKELLEEVMAKERMVIQPTYDAPALVSQKATPTLHVSPQVAMAAPSRNFLVSSTDFAGVWWDEDYDEDDIDVGYEMSFTPAVRPPRLEDLPDHTIAPPRGDPPPFRSGLPRSTYIPVQHTPRAGRNYQGQGIQDEETKRQRKREAAQAAREASAAQEAQDAVLARLIRAELFSTNEQEARDAAMARRLHLELNEDPSPRKLDGSQPASQSISSASGSTSSAPKSTSFASKSRRPPATQESIHQEHCTQAPSTRVSGTQVSVSVEEVNSEEGESDEEERSSGKGRAQSCKEQDDVVKDEDDSDEDGRDSSKGKGYSGQAKDYSGKGKGRSDDQAGSSDEQSQTRWKGKGKVASTTFDDKKSILMKSISFPSTSVREAPAIAKSSQSMCTSISLHREIPAEDSRDRARHIAASCLDFTVEHHGNVRYDEVQMHGYGGHRQLRPDSLGCKLGNYLAAWARDEFTSTYRSLWNGRETAGFAGDERISSLGYVKKPYQGGRVTEFTRFVIGNASAKMRDVTCSACPHQTSSPMNLNLHCNHHLKSRSTFCPPLWPAPSMHLCARSTYYKAACILDYETETDGGVHALTLLGRIYFPGGTRHPRHPWTPCGTGHVVLRSGQCCYESYEPSSGALRRYQWSVTKRSVLCVKRLVTPSGALRKIVVYLGSVADTADTVTPVISQPPWASSYRSTDSPRGEMVQYDTTLSY